MYQQAQQGLVVIEGRATYERILSSVREVETEEAIRQIQNFLRIYPEFAQAHNDVAVLHYQAGNALKALAHYEKAHKLEPANITFRKNLADFYFVELEWSDDAIQTYLDILKDNPFDVETLNALGTISVRIGRREQARQYFTRTLQLDAVNSQARQALQEIGGQIPPPSSPVRIPDLAVPSPAASAPRPVAPPIQSAPVFQPPQAPEELYRRALEQANGGNRREACRLLEDLLVSHPSYALAHNDLGVLSQQEGDIAGARRHHEEALRLQPDNPNFRKNLADLLYIACGETEEAMKLYVGILRSNPRDIEALKAISQICIEAGKADDARGFLETILKIEPWNSDARESLARIAAAGQKAQVPNAAARTADEIHAEAQRLAQENRLSEAHSMLEELVHIHPGHALGHNDLGVLRYRLGDVEGARCAYERAVELQPANGNFRKNLADLYFAELGRTDDAVRIYLDLHRRQPRDVEVLSGLGYICAVVGRPDEAKAFYRRVLEVEPWNAGAREALQQLP